MSLAHLEKLEEIAHRLSGRAVSGVAPLSGGGNNRLHRVDCSDGSTFALKVYPSRDRDPRDRLGSEFAALTLLAEHGFDDVPRAISSDRENNCALYEWVEGTPAVDIGTPDIDATLDFAARLLNLAKSTDLQFVRPASEACLSANILVHQIDQRRQRLLTEGSDPDNLRPYLEGPFDQGLMAATARARRGYDHLGLDFDADLPGDCQTLSPSDFGFHNAIRRPSGGLCFVDFEYFGWDDPVKLTADFLQHPGMTLSESLAGRFNHGVHRCFLADTAFQNRLSLLFPLYGLRWCMILLNEFLPDRWSGRVFAGTDGKIGDVQSHQLEKAIARLQMVKGFLGKNLNE